MRLQASTVLFKWHNQLLRYVFCPNGNVFNAILQSNGLAGLPSYLKRSCCIPKHLGKHSSKPTKMKMQFFYGLAWTCTESKASLYSKGYTACKHTCWIIIDLFVWFWADTKSLVWTHTLCRMHVDKNRQNST